MSISTAQAVRLEGGTPDGPWGAAQVAIGKALARNGITSTFERVQSAEDFMASMDQMEAAMDKGAAAEGPIDEAGMLTVDRGQADITVNFREQVDWAARGIAHHARYRHQNLRAIGRIVQPQYVGIAASRESGITSLQQIAVEKRPIGLLTVSRSRQQTRTMGYVTSRIFELAGFTQGDVLTWGGEIYGANDGTQAIEEGKVEVIALPAYSNWGPAWGWFWMRAQMLMNLHFLPVDEASRDVLVEELNLRKGEIPRYLFRGAEERVPTFVMADHVISTHVGLPDDLAYEIARAIDEHHDCLQAENVVFGYHPRAAWRDTAIPLHPGAEAYYRDRGYMA